MTAQLANLYGGGGGSRSACSFEFSSNLNKRKRHIGEIRYKAEVQVQNRYSDARV